MSGVAQYRKAGPRTFTPADGATIRGGRLVEAVGADRIQEAGAGSVKWLGVALTDAIAPEDVTTTPQVVNGRPVTAMYSDPVNVAVADAGIECKVVYAANANFGDRLVAASEGRVTPATGPVADARTIVGWCTDPGGVTVAENPRGLMRIA